MRNNSRTSARLLAFLALAACTVAVASVLASSGVGGGGGGGKADEAEREAPQTDRPERPKAPRRLTYTVKPGDTLGAIAEKTDTDVETLEELNPGVDSVSLVAGQKLKLPQ